MCSSRDRNAGDTAFSNSDNMVCRASALTSSAALIARFHRKSDPSRASPRTARMVLGAPGTVEMCSAFKCRKKDRKQLKPMRPT